MRCYGSYSVGLNSIIFVFIQISELGTEALKEGSEQSQCETHMAIGNRAGLNARTWNHLSGKPLPLGYGRTSCALHNSIILLLWTVMRMVKPCWKLHDTEYQGARMLGSSGKNQAPIPSPLWAPQNWPHRKTNKQQNCAEWTAPLITSLSGEL